MKTGLEKSTAKKQKKLKSDSSVSKDDAVSALYEGLISRERKRAFISSFVINFCLSYYFVFGVCYLGVETLELGELTPSFILGLGIGSFVLSILWTRSSASCGRAMVERTNKVLKGLREPYKGNWFTSFSGVFSIATLLMTAVLGWHVTEMSLYSLFSVEGLGGAQRIFTSLFTPEWSILGMVLNAMVQTIFIALMATFIAIPVAFVASFFTARNLMKGSRSALSVYHVLRVIFNFTRSVEPLIWAIIFSVWVGIGPFAGMLALMLHSVAALAKLYSEQIESIDQGPIEAIEATGANAIQVVWYAVVPQIILPYLSFTIYRWDINIRMATIIGLVGGGGVGTLLMQYQGLAKWHHVGTIVIVIAVVVWIMDYVSAKIREAIY